MANDPYKAGLAAGVGGCKAPPRYDNPNDRNKADWGFRVGKTPTPQSPSSPTVKKGR